MSRDVTLYFVNLAVYARVARFARLVERAERRLEWARERVAAAPVAVAEGRAARRETWLAEEAYQEARREVEDVRGWLRAAKRMVRPSLADRARAVVVVRRLVPPRRRQLTIRTFTPGAGSSSHPSTTSAQCRAGQGDRAACVLRRYRSRYTSNVHPQTSAWSSRLASNQNRSMGHPEHCSTQCNQETASERLRCRHRFRLHRIH